MSFMCRNTFTGIVTVWIIIPQLSPVKNLILKFKLEIEKVGKYFDILTSQLVTPGMTDRL